MVDLSIYMGTRIEVGVGISDNIGIEVKNYGCKKPIIITDKNLVKLGLVEKICKSLDQNDIKYSIFDGISENPHDIDIEKGANFFKNEEGDIIIAIGGGSPIDAAKGISIKVTQPGKLRDYEIKKVMSFNENKELIKDNVIPIIAIPTTAGSGSETSPYAVITDTLRNYKMAVCSPFLYPKVALVDPLLMVSLPKSITAEGGMDALSHAIEAFISKPANPFGDAFAIESMKLINNNLITAVNNGDNISARENMAIASIIGGIAATLSDCVAGHCMAESLGSVYNIAHGLACGNVLPVILEYSLPVIKDKLLEISKAFNIYNNPTKDIDYYAKKTIDHIYNLISESGLRRLKEVIKEEPDFELLSKKSMENVSVPSNPKKIGHDDFYILFKKLFDNQQ